VLSERIDAVSLGLALVSFVGVVFVSRPTILFGRSPDETKTSSTLAIACALLSAVARSVVYVSVRQLQQLHFMVVIHYYLLTTTVISALWLLLVDNVCAWRDISGYGELSTLTSRYRFLV
jgi:drug/metabolite transporter (DMT)-like permease